MQPRILLPQILLLFIKPKPKKNLSTHTHTNTYIHIHTIHHLSFLPSLDMPTWPQILSNFPSALKFPSRPIGRDVFHDTGRVLGKKTERKSVLTRRRRFARDKTRLVRRKRRRFSTAEAIEGKGSRFCARRL